MCTSLQSIRSCRLRCLVFCASVVTDGQSGLFPGDAYTTLLTRQVAEDEKAKGVIILAIGVGRGINVQELQEMASEPKDSHWTGLGGFGSLLKLSRAISGLCVPEIPDGSTRKWGLCLSPIGGAGFVLKGRAVCAICECGRGSTS